MEPGLSFDASSISLASYVAAFATGVMGGVHCVGMCGGIVGALGFGLPPATRRRARTMLPYVLAYNLGRVSSYIVAGAIAGYLGFAVAEWVSGYRSWFYLRIMAAVLMLGLGLYIAGWWTGLAGIERLGLPVWRRIQPIGQRLFPIERPHQALLLGTLWGWLPCGLVYTVLVWSLAAGGWRQGALLMASFGAGTLPLLLVMGLASASVQELLQRRSVRSTAGVLVILFGIWTLVATLMHTTVSGTGHTAH